MSRPTWSLNLPLRLSSAILIVGVFSAAAFALRCDSTLPHDLNYDSGVGAEFVPPERPMSDGSTDASDAQTAAGGMGGAATGGADQQPTGGASAGGTSAGGAGGEAGSGGAAGGDSGN